MTITEAQTGKILARASGVLVGRVTDNGQISRVLLNLDALCRELEVGRAYRVPTPTGELTRGDVEELRTDVIRVAGELLQPLDLTDAASFARAVAARFPIGVAGSTDRFADFLLETSLAPWVQSVVQRGALDRSRDLAAMRHGARDPSLADARRLVRHLLAPVLRLSLEAIATGDISRQLRALVDRGERAPSRVVEAPVQFATGEEIARWYREATDSDDAVRDARAALATVTDAVHAAQRNGETGSAVNALARTKSRAEANLDAALAPHRANLPDGKLPVSNREYRTQYALPHKETRSAPVTLSRSADTRLLGIQLDLIASDRARDPEGFDRAFRALMTDPSKFFTDWWQRRDSSVLWERAALGPVEGALKRLNPARTTYYAYPGETGDLDGVAKQAQKREYQLADALTSAMLYVTTTIATDGTRPVWMPRD